MENRQFDRKTVGLLAGLLVLSAGAVMWTVRQVWTDHDVSDPGVTLQSAPGGTASQ